MFDDPATNSEIVDDWEEFVHVDLDSNTLSAADSVSISLGQAEELAKFGFICERRMKYLSDDVNGNKTFKRFAKRGPFRYYRSCNPHQPFATYPLSPNVCAV